MATLQGYGPEGDWIRARFETQWQSVTGWTAAQMLARVAWGNRSLSPPDNEPWVRVNVRHSGADQASTGPTPRWRHDGMVVIEVFVPSNEGEGEIDDLCDSAASIFRGNRSQEGLRFRAPTVVNVGLDRGWYRKNVLCPFVRDTVF